MAHLGQHRESVHLVAQIEVEQHQSDIGLLRQQLESIDGILGTEHGDRRVEAMDHGLQR